MESPQKLLLIGELERLSGVPRRTIHFYLQMDLLHPPVKTGLTMSYYGEAHLNKLKHIKEAKRQGLPLIAIREQIVAREARKPDMFGPHATDHFPLKRKSPGRKKLPRKAQGKKTRESIEEVSCRLFRQKGYKNTRISDITKQLNIGKGTFYFYFSDKKELFLECVPRLFGELFSKGWNRIQQEEDPVRRLELRAQEVIPVLPEFCAIIQLAREALEDPDPKIKRQGEQIFHSIRKPLESDIEKGIRAGIFKPLDPAITGTIMIGIMESLAYLQKVDKYPLDERTREQIFRFIASGLTSLSRQGDGEEKL